MKSFRKHPYFQPTILFLLGAFSVLGFAPYYFYPAPIIAVLCLCIYWYQARSIKQAAKFGFIYGLGLYTVGIYWIYISLHTFGGMPAVMAAFFTFLLAAFMALFPALAGALSKWLSDSNPKYMVIAIPVFWALSDWVRSWIFTGFPWLTMGYSQVPYSPLAGYTPIIGIYGISMITVLIASLLALLWVNRANRTRWKYTAFALVLSITLVSGLLKFVSWTTPIGKPISVALLQGNISQEIKWSPEYAQKTIDLYLGMVKKTKADLVVLPETALPVVSSQIDPAITNQIISHITANNGNLIMGMVEYRDATESYFNSAISYGIAPSQYYQKDHLVPFGEFIPLKFAFAWIYRDWLNMPLSDMSRGGTKQIPMQLGNQKVAVNVCYEDVFGEEIIRQLPQATLLVNISNDAWYGKSYAAYQHMQFSQARALETGRMALRATNTGATAIIDSQGYVVAHAPHDENIILQGQAQGYTGTTPYVRFGNWLFLIISFIAILWIALPKILVRLAKTK
ncbi:MAG TPA: apolipoprotein N-acyltransferase [Methylotenera sp.]|nr:apolipoprotein N-acyltransferase [Methylotenera sp.]